MAYINFVSGFKVTSKSAIDERIILSKADMLAVSNGTKKFLVPDVYFALCSDNNKFYLYASKDPNHAWSPETGYYHPIEEFFDFASSEKAQEKIDVAIDKSKTITNVQADLTTIEETLNGTEEKPGLIKKVTTLETQITNLIIDGGEIE